MTNPRWHYICDGIAYCQSGEDKHICDGVVGCLGVSDEATTVLHISDIFQRAMTNPRQHNTCDGIIHCQSEEDEHICDGLKDC